MVTLMRTEPTSPHDRTTASNGVRQKLVRVAALMHVALGLGFGIGSAWTLFHLARSGELPMTPFGFRSLGGGPFEQLDRPWFSALAVCLTGVCALDVLAGAWLWQGRRRGGRLALVTSAPALALSVGFALPFLLIGVPVRAALGVAGWKSLH